MKQALFTLFTVLLALGMYAQTPDTIAVGMGQPPVVPPDGGQPSGWGIIFHNHELLLSCILLFFGTLFMAALVFAQPLRRLSPGQYLRLLVIGLIVFASLFLITAGYDSQQSAPAFGVLGTILGYILGKSSDDKSSTPEPGNDS